MNESWFADIEPYIFTYNKYQLADKDGAEFPDLFCTTINSNDIPAVFPTLLLREISQVEMGQDLDNATVNAVMSTFESTVFSLNEEECRAVTTAQSLLMKGLRFNAVMLPLYSVDGNVYMSTARYRRIIGAGDIDITE